MEMKLMDMKVRCKCCGWTGFELELDFRADPACYEVEICPVCGEDHCFEELGLAEIREDDCYV